MTGMADFDTAYVTWPGSDEVRQTVRLAVPDLVAQGFTECDSDGQPVAAKTLKAGGAGAPKE